MALATVQFFSMLMGGVVLTIVLGPDDRGHTGTAILIGALAFGVVGFTLMQGKGSRLHAD